MGTFKNGIISFCFILVTVFGVVRHSVACNEQKRECVKITFTSQIGIEEYGSANAGSSVEKYLKSTNLTKGYAWCAAFVNWTLEHCGIKTHKSAWSPSWFDSMHVVYQNGIGNPRPGDVFGIYFSSKNRIAHVGFIYEWKEGSKYCITVEGNTNEAGSREGDGVFKKRRLKSQIDKVANWIDA